MNKMSKIFGLLGVAFTVATFISCSDDDDNNVTSLISEGNSVTVRNTYADSKVQEISFASYLDYAFRGSDVEFPEALKADLTASGGPLVNALYSINFTENTIEYKLLPTADDAFWKTNYRTLEAGVKDRYYFTLPNGHNVSSTFTATDDAVNVRIDSDNVFVVEIGEGFVFQPGAAFTITLNAKNTANPAISQGDKMTVRNTYADNNVSEISFASYLDYAFKTTLGKAGLDLTANVITKGVALGEAGLDLTSTISYSTVEFPEALKADLTANGGPFVNGLYSININEKSIEYTLLPTADDMFWKRNYRTLEAGVKDRYYLTFSNPHGVTSFTATNDAVNLRIDSDNVLVVEIGKGFVFQPGAAFTINLN